MPIRSIATTSLAVMLGLVGCTFRSNHSPSSTHVVGCWASNQMALDTFGLFLNEAGEPGRFMPAPPTGTPIRHRWLRLESSDSIRINFGHGGFVGMTVQARLEADSLVGWTLPFTDEAGGPEPIRTQFVARRIECPRSWSNP